MRPFVTIVIPTRNDLAMITQVLDGIRAYTRAPFEVVVVDNASTDATVVAGLNDLAQRPEVRVLRMDANRYYWPAINAGIHAASAQAAYVLALNDDVVVQGPAWLDRLIDALGDDPRAGWAGDVQASDLFPPLGGHTDGYCALFRRELFDDVGFFDERWPFYWGFVDLQLRAHRRGWRGRDVKRPGDRTDHIAGVVTHLRGRTIDGIRDTLDADERARLFGSRWTPTMLLAKHGYHRAALALAFRTLFR